MEALREEKTTPFLSVDEQSTARTRNFSAWVQLVEPRKCLPETKTTPQPVREEDPKNKIVVRVN